MTDIASGASGGMQGGGQVGGQGGVQDGPAAHAGDDSGGSAWEVLTHWTEAEKEWWSMGPFRGGCPGFIRRIRRILDVSQRGLAALLGVSQSVVARWETGRTSPRVDVVEQLLRLARLEVTVRDQVSGEVVEPMRDDGARTHGGSRFPAHTDLRAVGWWIPRRLRSWTSREAVAWERRSRRSKDPAIGYTLDPHRKRFERERRGTPVDHPALHQFVAEMEYYDELREERRQQPRAA